MAYPGALHPDRFDELPPPKADWVELVPPGRVPKAPWPPKVQFERPMDTHRKTIVKVEAPPPPPPKPAKAKPAMPRKAIPGMSKDLAELLREQQMAQAAPEGMAKCPLCGAIIEPTKTKKVRTHDDPLKGARCEASNQPWAGFKGRPPRPRAK